jgi:hypothetical protein
MSFRVTANALFVSAILCGLARAAPCQSDLPAATPVVGCLSEKSGKLILTDNDGSYLLDGHTAELKAHIGDELSVSGLVRDGGDMKCGGTTDFNLPSNGSVNLQVTNSNSSAVSFVLTVVPFSDGVGYPEGSKAASIEEDGSHAALYGIDRHRR